MFIKLIKIGTTPDRRAAFLERQKLWNDAMSRCAGFIDAVVAHDSSRDTDIYIFVIWRDRESLEAFMRDVHDDVQSSSGIRDTYDEIAVAHLEVDDTLLPSDAGHLLFGTGLAGIITLSEAYRGSAVLRTALAGGFFDAIDSDTVPLGELAARLHLTENHAGRLAQALAALGLATTQEQQISLTEAARRYLRRDAPSYIGDLVLHNTRPALWERWGKLHEQIGLKDMADHPSDHTTFIKAMGEIAAAGQAQQLLERVDLTGRKRLLDIGGACGDYAVALAEKWPELTVDVLDLAETEPLALEKIMRSPAAERISFMAGDYRKDLPHNGYDVVLISNILRGETEADAAGLLSRIATSMQPGGLFIIQDLFPDTTAGVSGMFAALFGLHLPDALNPTSNTVASMLATAGYSKIRIELLDAPVIANKLIIATV